MNGYVKLSLQFMFTNWLSNVLYKRNGYKTMKKIREFIREHNIEDVEVALIRTKAERAFKQCYEYEADKVRLPNDMKILMQD